MSVSYATNGQYELWLGAVGVGKLVASRNVEKEIWEALSNELQIDPVPPGVSRYYYVKRPGDTVKVLGVRANNTDGTAPSVPSGLAVTADSETQLTASCNLSTDSGGGTVAGYQWYVDSVPVFPATVLPAKVFTGLTAYTLYDISVAAFDTFSNVSQPCAAVSVRTLDQTAPSVPTGLTAAELNDTTIRVSWTASVDTGAGLGGYTLYRDGVFAATIGPANTSYDDTGRSIGVTHAYKVRAFDLATPVNTSAFTSEVSAATSADSLAWNSGTLSYPGVEGESISFDCDTVCTSPAPAIVYTKVGGSASMSGVSVAATGEVSGVRPFDPNAYIDVQADDGVSTALQDWQSRIQAPGVFRYDNFDYATRAELLAAAYQTTYATSAAGNKIDLDTTPARLLSGRANLRLNLFASEAPTQEGGNWAVGFAGPGQLPYLQKRKFYVQIHYWVDAYLLSFAFNNGNGLTQPGAIKFLEIRRPNASFEINEIVLQRSGQGYFPNFYRIKSSGSTTPGRMFFSARSNYVIHSFANNAPGDTSAPSSSAIMRQRFGPSVYSSASTQSQIGDGTYAGVSWATQFVPGAWNVIEALVDTDGQIIKFWHAVRGQAPQLFMGTMNAGLSTTASSTREFSGLQLLLRTEIDEGGSDTPNGVAQDTFINCGELIVSDNPIDFPFHIGEGLPYDGALVPANWPWTGSTDQ